MSSIDHAVLTAAGPPTVSISPVAEQVIPTGGSVTLTCSAEDCVSGSFTYMWYRDGVNVVNGSTLTISNASSTDFGRYECNATGNGGTGSAATYISEQSELSAGVELAKDVKSEVLFHFLFCWFRFTGSHIRTLGSIHFIPLESKHPESLQYYSWIRLLH